MLSSTNVLVRFRPLNKREANTAACVEYLDAGHVVFRAPDSGPHSFTFDKIYGEDATQEQVFTECVDIVKSVLEGYNGTIITYGQTGSGKTHTLIGNVDDESLHGVVPRAVRALADAIEKDSTAKDVQVRITVVEIYCEKIRDLLDPTMDNLQVKQDVSRGVYIEGATEMSVSDEGQLMHIMQLGLAQRAVSATNMNEGSSRSHCIVTVHLEKTCTDGVVQMGKLCMVDLAGSERQDKTGATGTMLAEGAQINKSLSVLANVIYALTDEKIKHVPYRDSKLTRVLQDSLGGTARTVLIICCSPSWSNAQETLSSLRFGSRAKGVQNIMQVNQKVDVKQLQHQLAAAQARITLLEGQIAEAQARAHVSGTEPDTVQKDPEVQSTDVKEPPSSLAEPPGASKGITFYGLTSGDLIVAVAFLAYLALEDCYKSWRVPPCGCT